MPLPPGAPTHLTRCRDQGGPVLIAGSDDAQPQWVHLVDELSLCKQTYEQKRVHLYMCVR